MLYQLPNGKVITLTVEEYLDLTDSDIQYLVSLDAGDGSYSPWHQSAIRSTVSVNVREIDTSIDYEYEDDEAGVISPGTIEVPLDDLPELPDTEQAD
jgi:hypothetical protein